MFEKIKKIKNRLKDRIVQKGGEKSIPTMSICMMGPRAVGKTTVMTSIFHESRERISEGSTLYLRAIDSNTSQLNDYYLMLQDAVAKKNASNLPASNTISEFLFGLGMAGRSESLRLQVRDFPGEYLTSQRKTDRDDVYNFMANATVILIAIDTPYLMEKQANCNTDKNKIDVVTRYLKENVSAVRDKLVLFVPLKCERYMHEGRHEQIAEATKASYKELINFFAQNNIASFITPIITLGGIEFDCMVPNPMPGEVSHVAKFRPWESNPTYKPLYCSQPLYYLLTYAVNYYEWQIKQDKGIWDNFLSSFFSYIKDDSDFYEESRKLSRYIIYNKNGFMPLTTNSILKIN